MSLGAGITLTDNGGDHPNGAGLLASPNATGPPDPTPPATKPTAMASSEDDKLVQDVLTSEVNTGHIQSQPRELHGGLTGSLDRCCDYAQQAQAEHRIGEGMGDMVTLALMSTATDLDGSQRHRNSPTFSKRERRSRRITQACSRG